MAIHYVNPDAAGANNGTSEADAYTTWPSFTAGDTYIAWGEFVDDPIDITAANVTVQVKSGETLILRERASTGTSQLPEWQAASGAYSGNGSTNYGVRIRSTADGFTMDGLSWDANAEGAIKIHGWRDSGIFIENADNVTLRYLHIFDNGRAALNGSSQWEMDKDGYGVRLSGENHTFEHLKIVDHPQDSFQGTSTSTTDNCTWHKCWLGNTRAHSTNANIPFSILAEGDILHSDGVQFYDSDDTIVNDCAFTDCLFTLSTQAVIVGSTVSAANRWTFENCTFLGQYGLGVSLENGTGHSFNNCTFYSYQSGGGTLICVQIDTGTADVTISDCIFYVVGTVDIEFKLNSATVTSSGNYFNDTPSMDKTVNGTVADVNFVDEPSSNSDFVFDLTPQLSGATTKGSSLRSVSDLVGGDVTASNEVIASEDTSNSEENPTTTYATDAELFIRDGSAGKRMAFLKFDLSAYSGKVFTDVKLKMRDTGNGSGSQAVAIYTLDDFDPVFSQLTWNEYSSGNGWIEESMIDRLVGSITIPDTAGSIVTSTSLNSTIMSTYAGSTVILVLYLDKGGAYGLSRIESLEGSNYDPRLVITAEDALPEDASYTPRILDSEKELEIPVPTGLPAFSPFWLVEPAPSGKIVSLGRPYVTVEDESGGYARAFSDKAGMVFELYVHALNGPVYEGSPIIFDKNLPYGAYASANYYDPTNGVTPLYGDTFVHALHFGWVYNRSGNSLLVLEAGQKGGVEVVLVGYYRGTA